MDALTSMPAIHKKWSPVSDRLWILFCWATGCAQVIGTSNQSLSLQETVYVCKWHVVGTNNANAVYALLMVCRQDSEDARAWSFLSLLDLLPSMTGLTHRGMIYAWGSPKPRHGPSPDYNLSKFQVWPVLHLKPLIISASSHSLVTVISNSI